MGIVGTVSALLAAFAVGFATSVPPAGPIAALMVRRSVEGQHDQALRVGVGAALVECAFAGLAALGLSLITTHARELHELGFVVAACVLPVLGARLAFWKSSARSPVDNASARSGLWLGASIAALNPTPLVSWATFISLLHAWRITVTGALIPFFGIAGGAGVLSWNLLLVSMLKRHLGKVPVELMARLVRGLGFVLLAIGLWAALNALHVIPQAKS